MASIADVSFTNVHLGSWIDRSKGVVQGANITITNSNGVILVAIVALFVQFVGQHLWGIASFIWHQCRVSHRPKSVLQYQQDVSLRNNGSPGQSIWYFLEIAWAWRSTRKESHGWWRLVVLPIFIPVLFQCIITATGILSSIIVDTSDVEILLRGDRCGVWQTPNQETILATDNQFMIENHRYVGAVREFSRIYARACYNKTASSTSSSCQSFTQRSIPYTTYLNESCPFDPITCIYSNQNLRMDTNEFDTNKVLGINTGKDNIHFRKVTSCAPLKPEIYTTRVNETGPNGESGYHMYWDWGTATWVDKDYIAHAQNTSTVDSGRYTMFVQRNYRMDSRLDYPDQSSFIPRKEFNTSAGDIFMMFLSAHETTFSSPCDDPWFSAHRSRVTNYNRTIYRSDYLMNPVGCVEQFSFCNPHEENQPCTPLSGILPAVADATYNLGLSKMQIAVVELIANAIYATNSDISQPISLLADDTNLDGDQNTLPTNQWALELQDMHNRALTGLQRLVVDFARGPESPTAQQFMEVPSTEARTLCSRVRARTSGKFSNVNIYGLTITFTLGSLIILVNMFLVNISSVIQKWTKSNPLRRETWIADSLLQLHKNRLDLTGSGLLWENLDKVVPTTKHQIHAAMAEPSRDRK